MQGWANIDALEAHLARLKRADEQAAKTIGLVLRSDKCITVDRERYQFGSGA